MRRQGHPRNRESDDANITSRTVPRAGEVTRVCVQCHLRFTKFSPSLTVSCTWGACSVFVSKPCLRREGGCTVLLSTPSPPSLWYRAHLERSKDRIQILKTKRPPQNGIGSPIVSMTRTSWNPRHFDFTKPLDAPRDGSTPWERILVSDSLRQTPARKRRFSDPLPTWSASQEFRRPEPMAWSQFLADAYAKPSNVDWCEANYVTLDWVAEAWNTFSSVPMTIVAFYGFYRARQHPKPQAQTLCPEP